MKIHILCCFLFLGGLSLYAQETKEEIEKKALAHFDKQEFIDATPLYLRLLSLEPRDPNYNYRYGTCLLYNSKRKESAFKYLNFAVTSGDVDMEAYYYLGRAYHLTYQFRKAIDNYEKYKKLAGTRASNKLDVNRQIEMCRNGQTLLANLSQTLVLKKQEIPINEFFRIYDLKDIGGELIVTAEFQTKLDKKYNHVPLIHFPSKSDRIFYSSYGDNESSGKDIYMRTRLPDKSWSLAQKVFGDVNTEYDEDFPYMHPDGRYLYFCSKGHNSMGGFDVFRSRYDPETNTYMKPENMDFAISSPDDDILYIVDSLDRYAYFASQRESEAGKINVYHVRVERIPVQIAIIKGTFASTIDPGNKELSIAVYSDATGKLMGNFETTNKGDYLINLPKGGKYQFVLQVGGKDTEYKQVIDVPYLKEFRPLKQKITETIQDGNEVVLIQNLFDELFDDPIAILAEVIQKQSQMQVNKDNYDLDSLDRIGEQRKVLANLGLEAYSHLEIRQMSQTKVDDLTARLEKSEERMAQALASIVDANQKTETLLKRADSLTLLANNTDDPEKKANYTRSAQQALINAKKQAEKIESAKIIAEFMEKDRSETFKRLEEAKKFNNELLAVSNDDENGFLAVLNNNKLYIEKELKTRTTIDAQFEMMSEINEQITRSEEARKKQKELLTQKESLEKEVQQLKDELANAKRKEADRIQQEIDNKENLLSDIVNEQNYLEKEVDKYNQAIFQKEVLADLNNYDGNQKYSSLDNVMNSISSEISSIDSRIEANEENIELYEANESESKIISEVIAPVNNKADELISSSANIDKSYEDNEITTEQYISAKEKTLKNLKNQIESLEKANDEIKNNQDYKSVVVKLNNNITSTEKELNQANSIREVEKTLASEFETISKQPENSNKSSKEIENNLIASLENKKSIVTRDESITADEKESKIAAIDKLIDKLENSDGTYFEKDTAIASTNESTSFTAEEKASVVDKVDKKYTSDIAKIQNDLENGKTNEKALVDRKTDYKEALETALEKVNSDIAKNGETPQNIKEKAILEQEIATVQSEIDELNQIIAAKEAAIASTNETSSFTAEEKATVINKVDKKYTSDIAKIQNDLENGKTNEKSLLDRKTDYKEALETALEKVNSDFAKNGETPQNIKEKAILEQEIATVQSEIDELNQIIAAKDASIASTNEATSFTAEEKASVVNKVDKTYTSDIAEIQNDVESGRADEKALVERKTDYKEALETALEKINSDIAKNGETAQNLKEKAILEQEITTVQSEIDELNQIIAAKDASIASTNESTSFTAEEKATVVNKVDRSYSFDIGELEEQLRSNEVSEKEVVARKEEYVNNLQKALDAVNKEIERKGESPERLKEKAILEQEIATVQSEIDELKQIIAAKDAAIASSNESTSYTTEEKTTVVNKVDKKYTNDIAEIQKNIESGKADEKALVERKTDYKEALETALEKINSDITKNGETPQNLKEKAILEQEIATVQSEIDELNQIIAAKDASIASTNESTSFTAEEKATVVDKVDRSYSFDIGELENQLRNNEVTEKEVVARKEEYMNNLQKALDAINKEIERKGESPERLKEKAILEQEIATVQSEIDELKQIIAAKEASITSTNETSSFTTEEKATVVNKVDRSYSFDIGELEQQLRNNEVTEKEVVARKEEYLNNLQKALDAVNKEIERKGESPERLKEKAILEQEIATVQSEIDELKQIIAAKDASIASTNESTSFTAEEKATVVNKVDRSYSFDIGELEQKLRNNEVSQEEVVARKEEYVNNLKKALDAVNKEIERKGESPERLKEKAILEQEIAAVRLEIDKLQSPVATNEIENINTIAAKSKLSETEKAAIFSTDKNLPTLENKLAALDKLSLALKEQLSLETNEDIKLILTKEIETVEKQKRQVRFEIGEMEQETNIASVPDNVKAATNDKQNKEIESSKEKINDLSENKSALEESLSNASSGAEKEKIQSKIDKTDQKIAKEESKVLSTTTDVSKEVLTNELNNLSTEEKISINSLEAEQLRLNAEQLIVQANKEKDPEVKRNLLAEAQEKQNEALAAVEKTKNDTQTQAVVAEIVSTENIDIKEQESLFTSEEKLVQEQQAIDVQLLQIKDQLKEIDLALRTASKKEINQLKARRTNLVQLQKELIAKRNANEGDLAIIQQEKEENASKGIDKESINYELSYKEEVEISESDNYKALFPAINKLEQKQYEMRVKEELIALNTAKINEILKNNSSPTQEDKEEVSNLLKSIAKEQNEIETIRLEIREQQSIINNLLPSDSREKEITQNLLARNVTPVDKAPMLPVMATGLVIADEGENIYTKENPIPLDIEKPKGLFFRVQIGAFGKPVPDETFNDFSPVSGEQVRPGLIRYMAGYFGGRGDAEQARDRIRAMGYSDAFVVAYCDGERIPVYRAVQLIESGACVPSITSSESPIIAASEAGTNTTSGGFEAELDEFAYNKAPGAAEALAGETKLGLYYTVQVGVYNRPVPASQLKNISPLVTMRLPNGQMRYSSGMFDDVPQARVKQQEAIGLGITDAFIVAYYKGERITVAQANKLLQEFGNSILETVTPTQRKKNNLESTVRAPKPPADPVLKDKKFTVQFISKETYSSYPTQVLNRYNESGGMFYYDETTGLIQSVIYNEDQVPSLVLIRNELEEKTYYGVFELLDKEATDAANAVKDTDQLVHMLTVKLAYNEISDDLMNTFIKVNVLKRISSTESGVIMYFYEKETAEKINSLQTEMARLGATEILKTSFTCDLKDK